MAKISVTCDLARSRSQGRPPKSCVQLLLEPMPLRNIVELGTYHGTVIHEEEDGVRHVSILVFPRSEFVPATF